MVGTIATVGMPATAGAATVRTCPSAARDGTRAWTNGTLGELAPAGTGSLGDMAPADIIGTMCWICCGATIVWIAPAGTPAAAVGAGALIGACGCSCAVSSCGDPGG